MPLLVGQGQFAYWQPPDLADPGNPLVPHSQIGSVSPYVEAARLVARGAARAGGVRTEPVAAHEPVAVHVWRSGAAVHVLLGNLESGWMGDARFPRHVTLILPRVRCGLDPVGGYALRSLDDDRIVESDPDSPTGELRFSLDVRPEWFRVLRLERHEDGVA